MPVGAAHFIHIHKQTRARRKNNDKANENIYPGYIQNGKDNHQAYQAASQVPDILGLQPFELNGLIYAFVDLIDGVGHAIA